MKWAIVILILLGTSPMCLGQESDNTTPDFSFITDELVGLQEEDAAYEEVYENLVQLMAHPIDLNTGSREELQRLHLLTDQQIEQLIAYRHENGKLVNLHELQAVPDLDLQTIQKILPFVTVIDPEQRLNTDLLHRIFQPENTIFLTRVERTLETKKGFSVSEDPQKKFNGSPEKIYMRFRNSKPGDFSFGFTAEKDAGESLRWSHQQKYYGADFFSFHAQVMNKGVLKNLVIGDYQCQAGQGLILGNAFGLGKGGETITTTRRSNLGIVPYSSANENGFYRGVAGTVQLHPHLSLSGFYSSVMRDASLTEDTLNTSFASALQTSGLHRNTDELMNRKNFRETNWGSMAGIQRDQMEAGLILHHIRFERPVLRNPLAYNQFAFEGKENTNMSVYLNYRVSNFNFFSELGKSFSAGTAVVAGMMASLHPDFDMAIVFRKYDRNFYSFYGNPFSENTAPQNETGIYWGWKYRFNKRYSISGYADLYKFPWLAFRRYAPSSGHEWLLRFNYQPNRKTTLFIQAREELKPRNQSQENNLYTVESGKKRNFWMAAHYSVGEHLKFKSRIQYSTFSMHGQTTEGITLLQDLTLSVWRFQVTARHALFDTDDFDNRQYVYENDVWLAFSLPAYEGKGVRNYVLLECKISKKISVWLRYARTRYTDRETIGSGLEEIAGNTKNDLKFQALLKI
jgi:hypothetical protein